MTNYLRAIILLAATCVWAVAALAQQNPAANAAAADDVSLFVASCMNFSGNPKGLRDWLIGHGFKHVSEQAAAAVLNGHSAEVYAGQTKWGGPALIASIDNGYCVLNVADPGKDIADAIFQSIATSNGATFAALGKPTLDDDADRSIEEVMWHHRDWVITTAVAASPDDPGVRQLDMIAAPVPAAGP